MGAHLSPWIAGVIGPFIVWLMKKTDPFVEEHAREALNFHLSLLVYAIASIALFVLGIRWGVFMVLWALLMVVISVLVFVLMIIAAIKASNGEAYRYPLTIRFVSRPVS